MEKRLRDLIELPSVRTVIQLSDTSDPKLKKLIGESFVLTQEVYFHFLTILQSIKEGQGEGFFVLGNYGSGKSHFLSILDLLLREEGVWGFLVEQRPALQEYSQWIQPGAYLVASDSLVDYQAWERLEDIILTKIQERLQRDYNIKVAYDWTEQLNKDLKLILKERYPKALASFLKKIGWEDEEPLFEPSNYPVLENLILELNLPYKLRPSRHQVFQHLQALLETGPLQGIVILLDELSEFLRSKPTGRAFNEDIRFLQFLGEWANKHSLWIIATLQERIEDTGDIPQEAFNKIKDRYPKTISLTARHIEELIHQRLIRKKPGAEEIINQTYQDFKTAFSTWMVPQDRFYRLYPVHPQTLKFLDQLKPLFSQHRGIVDFIHYQLQGDPGRRIPGMLELPSDILLTPDSIFDHFLRRIKERVETNPYSEVVYKYYEESGESIFPEPEERALALKIIKTLILQAISPWRYQISLRELAETLLTKVSTWDSEVNYQYIRDICEKLYKQGSYIGKKPGAGPLEDIYYIDLEADINLIIRRKVEYIEKGLEPGDSRIFYRLAHYLDSPQLPLAWLHREGKGKREIKWQNTPRWGYLILSDLRENSLDLIASLIEEFNNTELDFVLFLATPFQLRAQQEYLLETLLPYLRSHGPEDTSQHIPLIFWLPGPVEDEKALRRAYAHSILLEESKKDSTQLGQRLHSHLEAIMADDKRVVKEVFTVAYYDGTLISNLMEQERSLGEIGQLSFDRSLQEIIPPVLAQRFPRHQQLAPYTDIYLRGTAQELISSFLKPGQIVFPKGTSTSLKLLIESYLRPLKIIKNIPNGFHLAVDPRKSSIVAYYLQSLEEGRVDLKTLYWRLRKSPYGISFDQFQLLTLALIFSGQIIPYSQGKRKPLEEITTLDLANISEIGPGELLSATQQKSLQLIPLIPPQLKKEPLTIQQQQAIWEYLRQFKEERLNELNRLRTIFEHAQQYPAGSGLDWAMINEEIGKMSQFLEAIEPSYSSKEGLERFLESYQQYPLIGSVLQQYQTIKNFFFNYLDKYFLISRYLQERGWSLPSEERYQALAAQREGLIERLRESDKVFDEEYLEGLFQAFEPFKENYITLYQEGHRKYCSPERFTAYHQLRKSPDYRLLSLLAQIEPISVKDDLVKVERQLARIDQYQCPGPDPQVLQHQPFCLCGYQLGHSLDLAPVAELEAIIQKGIREYVQTLQEPMYCQKIMDHIADLEVIGDNQVADVLKKVLEIKLDDPGQETGLANLISPRAIQSINEALKGHPQPVVARDLDELYENLVERTFSRKNLLKIFNEWLSGTETVDDQTRIKITGVRKQ